jgi:hypothetical protein
MDFHQVDILTNSCNKSMTSPCAYNKLPSFNPRGPHRPKVLQRLLTQSHASINTWSRFELLPIRALHITKNNDLCSKNTHQNVNSCTFTNMLLHALPMLYTHINTTNLQRLMSRPTSQKYLSLMDLNVSCPWPKGIHYMFNNKGQNLLQKNINIKMGSTHLGLNCSLWASFFSKLQ